MLLRIYFIFVCLCLSPGILAQLVDTSASPKGKIEINGRDTFFVSDIDAVYFFYPSKNLQISNKEHEKNLRLIRNVKKAYMYAKIANDRLIQIDRELQKIPNKKKQKEYLENAEKELKKEFEDDLKKLTITQGRILMKLIDRETGNTTYYLVKEIKGTFTAVFWQSLARIFGHNLKSEYDPQGEDKEIEAIIQMIDKGLL